MGKPVKDLKDQRFGKLTVIERAVKPEGTTQTGAFWLCSCECGNRSVVYGVSLTSGHSKSCGCLKSQLAATRMSKMRVDQSGTIDDRFFSRFSKTDSCWEWTAHRDKDGYGVLPLNNSNIRAHRFSYQYHVGEIPKGYVICHKCDNPGCVNPDHLFVGTVKDNVNDMLTKERDKMVGARNNKAKLNEFDINNIRESDLSTCELAREYGVSRSTIRRARDGSSWKHVKSKAVPERSC